MEKKVSLIYAQSGGPTSVINASAYGVIEKAKELGIEVYASIHGIDGILKGNISKISNEDPSEIDRLRYTPASAFGSCRKKLPRCSEDDSAYKIILDVFKKLNVKYFVYNGGNDSMNTCDKIAEFMKLNNYDCQVVGIPKTIDNDLLCTDHCPGYGSAAKFVATTIKELALDTAVYAHGRVTVVEVMGRDAGWLTASSALACASGDGPDLIYLPEKPFSLDDFVQRCKEVYDKKHTCLVAVSEGIRDKDGVYINSYSTETVKDNFNNVQIGGVCAFLASYITNKTGIKTRSVELSLLQRCASHIRSLTDTEEAIEVGRQAVLACVENDGGNMIAIKRISSSPYAIEYVRVPLEKISNGTQSMPDKYISEDGSFVTKEFIEYAQPLIMGEFDIPYEHGVPRYAILKNEKVEL